MPKIYYYKLTVDDGGAPCVQNGLLSLAICKPMIRKTAGIGDLIFGFAANSLNYDNRLLYIAKITRRLTNGSYYTSKRYANRIDCIYEQHDIKYVWRKNALFHGADDLRHDLGKFPVYERANVLLSTDFRYFGSNGTSNYKTTYPLIKDAIEHLGEGHRVRLEDQLRDQFIDLKNATWKQAHNNVVGRPTSKPNCDSCHRGKSCGVIEATLK